MLEVRKQYINFTYGKYDEILRQEKRDKTVEKNKRKMRKPNTNMENVGKSYEYHEIEPCLNEVQRGWYITYTMLLAQSLITPDKMKSICLTGCNSLLWGTYKITCKKSSIKARKGENDNTTIWLKVSKIFHLKYLENNSKTSPDAALYFQGRYVFG